MEPQTLNLRTLSNGLDLVNNIIAAHNDSKESPNKHIKFQMAPPPIVDLGDSEEGSENDRLPE